MGAAGRDQEVTLAKGAPTNGGASQHTEAKGPQEKPRKPHSSEAGLPCAGPPTQGVEEPAPPPTLPWSWLGPAGARGGSGPGDGAACKAERIRPGRIRPGRRGCQGHKRQTARLSHRHIYILRNTKVFPSPAVPREGQPSGGGHTATRSRPVGRQGHGRQEQRLQLARQAGNLGILGLVRLDQAGKLKDTCKGKQEHQSTPPADGCAQDGRRGQLEPESLATLALAPGSCLQNKTHAGLCPVWLDQLLPGLHWGTTRWDAVNENIPKHASHHQVNHFSNLVTRPQRMPTHKITSL